MGTVIVLAGLGAVVALIIRSMIKDKKNGKSPVCGGDCSQCKGCHQNLQEMLSKTSGVCRWFFELGSEQLQKFQMDKFANKTEKTQVAILGERRYNEPRKAVVYGNR